MNLTARVITATLVPFLIMLAGVTLLFNRSITLERETIGREDSFHIALVEERVGRVTADLATAGSIIANARESARAVEARDVRFLYDWSVLFHGRTISKIVITDLDGIVLSRSDDEFVFADSVADTEPFRTVLAQRRPMQGFFVLDGEVHLTDARPILQYGEIPVGTIATAVAVDKSLLGVFVEELHVGFHLQVGEQVYASGRPHEVERDRSSVDFSFVHPASMEAGGSAILYRSQEVEGLLGLQRRILFGGVVVLIVLLAVLVLLVRAYLQPYSTLVVELLALAEGKTAYSDVGPRYRQVFQNRSHEATRIADSVARFVATSQENIALLETLSITDQLTKLNNRRRMEDVVEQEIERAKRYDGLFAVLICDVDHFKSINDAYGHQTGDEVLRKIASLLNENSRATDIVGRWGGEEFLLVCPQLDATGATVLAEKLRAETEQAHLCDPPPGPRPVGTISIGIAMWAADDTTNSIIRRADAGLYQAKRDGRNRVGIVTEMSADTE